MHDLISAIDQFMAEHNLSESQFGLSALNDKNFVPQLRGGRDIRIGTAEKVRAFMDGYSSEQAA